MDLYSTAFLFFTMALLAALPSASVLLVVSRSITHGVPSGLAVALGIVLGDLLFVGFALLGLTALAEVMGSAFALVKYIGGMYLVWFGISLLRSAPSISVTPNRSPKRSLASSLLAGFALTLGDLKAILFYSSLLPMFIKPGTASAFDVVIVLMATIFSVGGVKSYYALIASKLMDKLAASNGVRHVRPAAGVTLVGAGFYVMAKS